MSEASARPLVLFLCTGNSARSQMAEALLRDRAGDRFEVASAGMEPKGVHPLTVRVLGELGLPTSGLRSKPSTEFLGRALIRYAIIVCENAQRSCPRVHPFAAESLFWPFDDPAGFEGNEAEKLVEFRRVRDQIAARIDEWLGDLGPAR